MLYLNLNRTSFEQKIPASPSSAYIDLFLTRQLLCSLSITTSIAVVTSGTWHNGTMNLDLDLCPTRFRSLFAEDVLKLRRKKQLLASRMESPQVLTHSALNRSCRYF